MTLKYGSLKVTPVNSSCHFLLATNSIRGRILHRLWNTVFERFAVSLFCYPSCA